MLRQNLTLAGVGLLVLAALAFLGWAALRPLTSPVVAATPQPGATAPASALPDTAPATVAAPVAAMGGVIATTLFTMTLPEGWQGTTEPLTGDQPEAITQLAPLVIAWPAGTSFAQSQARFSIAAMPRNALSLEQYMADVAEHFSSTTGVDVVDARLVTDLRHDGLPAALIHYVTTSPTGEISGYQAATFDATGTQLLIATLVHQIAATDGERLFYTLVGALHLPANQAPGE